jgi:cysteine desulfurase
MTLDGVGLCVGFGSACSAMAPEPSPALLALGLTPSQARATIRVSLAFPFEEPAVKESLARFEQVLSGF